jgi:hypothetical protein
VTSPQPGTPAAPPQAASGSDSRPEPVRNAAAIASLLTTLAGVVLVVLVLNHVLTPEGSAVLGPALAAAIPTFVGAVSTIIAALHARGRVTPLASPDLAALGIQLVEAGENVAETFRQAVRRPGPQAPGVADHAAPDTPPGG